MREASLITSLNTDCDLKVIRTIMMMICFGRALSHRSSRSNLLGSCKHVQNMVI